MKRVVGILFLFCIGMLSAQSYKMGVTGNIHKSTIVNIHDVSKPSWGGGVGVFAQFALVENDVFDSAWLYLMPQLEFSMQGENAEPPQGKQQFPNHYIGLPIYIKYFFHKGNMKRDVFLIAGPRLEFLVSHDRKGPEVYPMFVDQEKKINKFGFGLSVGAGLKLSDNMEAFIRFDRGFSKVYPDYIHKSTTYNRLLGIGVNYYIKTE